jgi:hypothetical protein
LLNFDREESSTSNPSPTKKLLITSPDIWYTPRMKKLSFKRASQLFRYEEKTGIIYRKIKSSKRNQAGEPVGSKITNRKKRYLKTKIGKSYYLVHRIVWLLKTRSFPKGSIDHQDGNGLNNIFENLRDVPLAVNNKNIRIGTRNTSGVCGVYMHKKSKKWVAQIVNKKKWHYLGFFKTLEEGIKARETAKKKFNFHPRHGNHSS